jgi:hypothetical protein
MPCRRGNAAPCRHDEPGSHQAPEAVTQRIQGAAQEQRDNSERELERESGEKSRLRDHADGDRPRPQQILDVRMRHKAERRQQREEQGGRSYAATAPTEALADAQHEARHEDGYERSNESRRGSEISVAALGVVMHVLARRRRYEHVRKAVRIQP